MDPPRRVVRVRRSGRLNDVKKLKRPRDTTLEMDGVKGTLANTMHATRPYLTQLPLRRSGRLDDAKKLKRPRDTTLKMDGVNGTLANTMHATRPYLTQLPYLLCHDSFPATAFF
jgi:hypothetical protein